ncbi:hypothetical protein, partial [Hominenteromicrobium sp.]|uniref:hypothetical protein n=1 Tax=Hominenteromicrobium sp. TaxID=3073581 RepID=UPI003AEF7745
MLDGYYEKSIFYSSSESRAEGIENNNKNAVTGGILRLLSWFMFLRFAFPQKKTLHIKCTKSSKQDIIVQA